MNEVRVYAPGRVNLIGEHTDYQEGFVLPFAVDAGVTLTVRPRPGMNLRLTTNAAVPSGWESYPQALVWLMRKEGFTIPGFEGRYESDLPVGEGLSSSAALLVATALAACELAGRPLTDRARLADLCRQAEGEAAGVRCGIMDPWVSLFGRAGCGLLLDCRSREHVEVDLRPDRLAFLVADSGVRRSLSSAGYNTRREECEEAVRRLREQGLPISTLRDVTVERLEAADLPAPLDRRARHVVTENARARAAADALPAGDLGILGILMLGSHESLRRDFEVSTPELDILVSVAAGIPGVLGSRLTGAGFGGSTITAVQWEAAASAREELERRARERTGHDTIVREVFPSAGATVQVVPTL